VVHGAGEIVDGDAVEIGDLYERAKSDVVGGVLHLAECGRKLAAKQAAVGHGKWISWLSSNAGILGFDTPRTAQRLIKLAANATLASPLEIEGAAQLLKLTWGHKGEGNHRAQGTGENEWYTPARYIEAAREVMGGIDLDPATSAIAQRAIGATQFFTRDDDGLSKPWTGRVWLNPPYSQPDIAQFCHKLVSEVAAGAVEQAVLLTHNYTDTAWFHEAESVVAAICFTRGRIKFVDSAGNECAPTQGQAFFYYGKGVNVFRSVFEEFGFVR
jgi:ParB family chromosome partitioning protein